jgi:hypothetical protein
MTAHPFGKTLLSFHLRINSSIFAVKWRLQSRHHSDDDYASRDVLMMSRGKISRFLEQRYTL